MKDSNCAYCMEGDLVAKFGIKIRELKASKVYLFKEQSHRGRVIVASKCHVSEMIDLSDAERRAFMDDVALVAAALRRLYKPTKINYGAYGDTGCHLHFHLVPKYADDAFEWGGVFAMNPDRTYLTEAEYAERVAEISAELVGFDGNKNLRKSLLELKREIEADGKVDFTETTFLLRTMRKLGEDDAVIAEFCNVLRSVRSDGVIDAAESDHVLSLLNRILA